METNLTLQELKDKEALFRQASEIGIGDEAIDLYINTYFENTNQGREVAYGIAFAATKSFVEGVHFVEE